MALGGVFMSDTDGNIGTSSTTSTEKVTGLLFDISKQAKFFEEGAGLAVKDKLQGNVIEINSMDDLKELGITAYPVTLKRIYCLEFLIIISIISLEYKEAQDVCLSCLQTVV